MRHSIRFKGREQFQKKQETLPEAFPSYCIVPAWSLSENLVLGWHLNCRQMKFMSLIFTPDGLLAEMKVGKQVQ